jgi:hypothetical protein
MDKFSSFTTKNAGKMLIDEFVPVDAGRIVDLGHEIVCRLHFR